MPWFISDHPWDVSASEKESEDSASEEESDASASEEESDDSALSIYYITWANLPSWTDNEWN